MYSFYFKSQEEEIQLPIPPANMELKVNNKNKVVELLNIGDVNILKDPGLSEIDFKILLPGQPLPFSTYENGFKDPKYFLDRFEKYKIDKKPVRLIITRMAPWNEPLFGYNMLVSLENYSIEEKSGEVADIYVVIKLKQYKNYKTQVVEIKEVGDNKAIATVKEERPAKPKARTYTVKAGDTLWAIAKKELNDGSKYNEIAELNSIADPNKISIGQVLRLG